MTINKKVYQQIPDLIKLYRFEGGCSYHNFDFKGNQVYDSSLLNYIYFSCTMKHHQYFSKKKIQQLINKEILKEEPTLKLNYNTLLNLDSFKEIIKLIEQHPLDDKLISIEFSLSCIFESLLEHNHINNNQKNYLDRRIERVDTNKHKGGFGFCGEWLEIFNILTYFYCYQRITKENILDFLYSYRKAITSNIKEEPLKFLNSDKNRTVKVNEQLFHDFTKYNLMNALESIVENELYFEHSVLASNPQKQIKDVIKQYCNEREFILESFENEYQKRFVKTSKNI